MTDLEFPWNVLNVIMQTVTLAGQVIFIIIPVSHHRFFWISFWSDYKPRPRGWP